MFFFQDGDKDLTFKSRSIEHAYMALLNDDLKSAGAVFETIDSPRAKWGECLIQILEGYLKVFPTYFQIRNFLEIDLDFLLKNEKIDYVEQVLGALDILAGVNEETYKYAARVMLENGYNNAAIKYLDKSKKIFYKDPELHFMLTKYYMKTRDYEKANFYVNECLRILPDYYPAKLLQEEVSRYIKQ